MFKFPFTKAAIFLLSSVIILVILSLLLLFQSLTKVEKSNKASVVPKKTVAEVTPLPTPISVVDVDKILKDTDSEVDEVLSNLTKDLDEFDQINIVSDSQNL